MYDKPVRHTNNAAGAAGQGVVAEGIGKQFGDLWALRGLDLAVPAGSVLGLLGHNGAGKTTAIRILTTLSAPTEGRAMVAGFDVAEDPLEVRRRIGVAAQQATVDGLLSARANLVMVGRLSHLGKAEAKRRADDLLEQLDLADAADRLVKTFSGGMRRRLDLAASIVTVPEVLFLDEPTTGLDPRSRGELWEILRELVRDGTTVILTTQYLEEADRLADDIVLLDHGRMVAHGTPDELKSRVGEDRVDIVLPSAAAFPAAVAATRTLTSGAPSEDADLATVTIPVVEGTRMVDVLRALDAAGIDTVDLQRRRATLDDVFLTLTGTRPDHDDADDADASTTDSTTAPLDEVFA